MMMKQQRNHKNNISKNTLSTIKKIAVLPIIIIGLLNACGISDVPVYNAPYIANIEPGVISITHNTANNVQSFIGYKVYYKLYKKNDITLPTDKDYITDTTRTPYPSTITAKKFRELIPVRFEGSRFQLANINPLIRPSNKASSTTYYLDFSAGAQEYSGRSAFDERSDFTINNNNILSYQAVLIESSNMTILHRNLNDSSHKPFFNEKGGTETFTDTDSDIKSMIGDSYTSGDELDIVFAVIPYGIDFSNLQKIYGSIVVSEATRLEYTVIP